MNIANNILEAIGNTPLVRINRLNKGKANVYAKMESFNPAGSAKDRVALAMIEDAEKRGILSPGGTIIEPTSGNTGIGLALVAVVKGYQLILTMPDSMSIERRRLLAAYGAKVVLTPAAEGMIGSINKALEIQKTTPNSFIPQQFQNPANPASHRNSTGPEIWKATDGKVDIFVAGVGTGGTLTGVAQYLKEKNPKIEIVAVEPADSPMITQGKSGPHKIQGIGANFIPKILDLSLVSRTIPQTYPDAIETMKAAATREGLLVGISSGAALHAALELSKEPNNAGKNIVVLLPDSGERYLA